MNIVFFSLPKYYTVLTLLPMVMGDDKRLMWWDEVEVKDVDIVMQCEAAINFLTAYQEEDHVLINHSWLYGTETQQTNMYSRLPLAAVLLSPVSVTQRHDYKSSWESLFEFLFPWVLNFEWMLHFVKRSLNICEENYIFSLRFMNIVYSDRFPNWASWTRDKSHLFMLYYFLNVILGSAYQLKL